jgi:predicted MFS family arabinose efflux permease
LFAGAVAAGVSPSVYALVAGIAPFDRRASWLAVVVSGLLVSLALGAPIGGLVGASMGWPSVFRSAAVSLVLHGSTRGLAAGSRRRHHRSADR